MKYEFISAVLNSQKGEYGVHSIALVHKESKYWVYNDVSLYEDELDRVKQHPKLLFYIKAN